MDKLPEKCPNCNNVWTRTPKIVCNDVWVHCKPCGKKAKDIMEEYRKPKVNPHMTPDKYAGGKYEDEDWTAYDNDFFD